MVQLKSPVILDGFMAEKKKGNRLTLSGTTIACNINNNVRKYTILQT